jgi:hypothetical protein
MPIEPDSRKIMVPIIDKQQTASRADHWLVAADPDKVTITTETSTQVVDPGDPAAGISPMIQVTIMTKVHQK